MLKIVDFCRRFEVIAIISTTSAVQMTTIVHFTFLRALTTYLTLLNILILILRSSPEIMPAFSRLISYGISISSESDTIAE